MTEEYRNYKYEYTVCINKNVLGCWEKSQKSNGGYL